MSFRLRRFSQPLEGRGLHEQLNRLVYDLENQFNSISTPPAAAAAAPSATITEIATGGGGGEGGGGGGGVTSLTGTLDEIIVDVPFGDATLSLDGPHAFTSETQYSLLLGQGSAPISSLGVAGNGQIPIGSNGAAPVLATLTAGSGVTITNGPGVITIASTGGGGGGTAFFTIVTTATTPYTVAAGANIYIRGSATAGANQVVNLPAATGSGVILMFKKMDSNPHNLVVTPNGTNTIDTYASYTLTTQFSAIQILDAAAGVWDLVNAKP
jgi:hypothetical protein